MLTVAFFPVRPKLLLEQSRSLYGRHVFTTFFASCFGGHDEASVSAVEAFQRLTEACPRPGLGCKTYCGSPFMRPCFLSVFFPRASERRVLLIVGVCESSSYFSHLHIFTSTHIILSSSHLHISSSHLHIFSSSHLLHILTSSHLHISSSHLHIYTYHVLIFTSYLLLFTSAHVIFTSSHLHTFSSSHLHMSSSHLHIFTPSHLHIFSSSHLLIFSHLHIFTSSHLPMPLTFSFSHVFFYSSLFRPGAVPTRNHEMQHFRTK